MTLHQLRVFLAVTKSLSFARGAESLNLSQPTVSQHIAALEEELGVELLVRSKKGVSVTPAGKLLEKRAGQLLRYAKEARRELERFRDEEPEPLKVGVSTIPATYLVPLALPRLFAVHPEVQVEMVQGDSRETVERVISDRVELGLVGGRFDLRGLEYKPFGHDDLKLVVPPGHQWAKAGTICPEELTSFPFVDRQPGSGTGRTVGEALSQAGFDPSRLDVKVRLGSTEALKAAVLSGVGAAFISGWAIGRELERGDLAVVELEGVELNRSFYLVKKSGEKHSPAAAAFVAAMNYGL